MSDEVTRTYTRRATAGSWDPKAGKQEQRPPAAQVGGAVAAGKTGSGTVSQQQSPPPRNDQQTQPGSVWDEIGNPEGI